MARLNLPHEDNRPYLTDSGLETKLIFLDHIELTHFAAFVLLDSADGRRRLRRYFAEHAQIARRVGAGFVAESPTWRASGDWGDKLGYDRRRLADINQAAIHLLADLRRQLSLAPQDFIISGCVGPRGDGYQPASQMSPAEAEGYHAEQIAALADTPADVVSALTLTDAAEAIGITRAAQHVGVPVVISFTVETNGRLPSGDSLLEAIATVDAATGYGPVYYMVNCAHPSHLPGFDDWDAGTLGRLRGLRANASRRSHAELDASDALDAGDPHQLAFEYAELIARLPQLTVLGGCCGTDARHIQAIADTCIRHTTAR